MIGTELCSLIGRCFFDFSARGSIHTFIYGGNHALGAQNGHNIFINPRYYAIYHSMEVMPNETIPNSFTQIELPKVYQSKLCSLSPVGQQRHDERTEYDAAKCEQLNSQR